MKQDLFTSIKDIPIDPIFGINDRFLQDPRKDKINLTVGIFIEESGAGATILPSVLLAEEEILKTARTKNYLPIDGDPEYVELTKDLVFRKRATNIYGAQTLGGTSALRILGEFIKNEISDRISISDPTWENHENLFRRIGFAIDKYPYPQGMFEHIAKLPPKTVVLLHAMCHNPTGHDLTKAEWEKLEKIIRERNLIPFFDSAYQGFGTGLEEDAWPIRYFTEKGHELFVAHSYSKSFALYGERVGAAFVTMHDPALCDRLKRNIRFLIRTNYSNPPRHGAHIVKLVLQTPKLLTLWHKEMAAFRSRMNHMRKTFAEKLNRPDLSHGHGFFTLLGLTPTQIASLQSDFGIYMTARSRINLTALNATNIDYVVSSIKQLS